MSDGFPPVIWIDVYKTRPPRYRGKARRQPWRWRARNAGNNETMASGEAYGSEDDAIAAVVQLFGDGSTAFLRRAETGNTLLRRAIDTSGGEDVQ